MGFFSSLYMYFLYLYTTHNYFAKAQNRDPFVIISNGTHPGKMSRSDANLMHVN